MENLVIQDHTVFNNQITNAIIDLEERTEQRNEVKTLNYDLTGEHCDDLVDFIKWSGLKSDPDMIVLSSKHHYFYDADDLKNIRTVVNLKCLNKIKHIPDFLHSVCCILPQKCSFIGYFSDNTQHNRFRLNQYLSDNEIVEDRKGTRTPLIGKLYIRLDYRKRKYLTKRRVRLLLEAHGFSIINMTDLNSMTYFHAQKA